MPSHQVAREQEPAAIGSKVPKSADCIVNNYECVGVVTQYSFVELADNGTNAGVQLPAAAGNRCIGVALEAGAIGDVIPVCTFGLALARIGATLTAPDALQADTDGDGIAAATADIVCADLLEDGVDTDIVQVFVYGPAGYAHA